MTVMNADEQAAFENLLAVLADAFEREARPAAAAAALALRAASIEHYRPLPSSAAPGALLDAACRHPDALALAASISACRGLIAWSHWAGEGLDGAVSASLYSAELVGPDGHVPAPNVRVGLLISDRATDYPISRHAGEETYLVISGTAEWALDRSDYRRHAPGALVHHPAWTPHGRRTLGEPFLGAWRWSGDLDLSSFSVDP
jgi:hypothetical protein